MIGFIVKMGLGLVGGVTAGPLGGATGYALGEFIFDEDKQDLELQELATKYAVKVSILTVGGFVGGFAGELLGSSVGVNLNRLTETIPGDVSEKIADALLSSETVANLFDELCNSTANSCLSEEAKAALIKTYFDKFDNTIIHLIDDGKMEEMIGRELVKNWAKTYAYEIFEQLELAQVTEL